MNELVSIPYRVQWACLAILLMIGIGAGCSCRPEQAQRDVGSSPVNPAVTDTSATAPGILESEARESAEGSGSIPATEPPQTPTGQDPAEQESGDSEMVGEDSDFVDPNDELDFGEPLFEGLTDNERLDPIQSIWLTKDRKSVVMQAMVCQTQAPLEMFACLLRSKEHESVLAVPVKAFVVHAGLLAAGSEPGTPVRWDPEYAPPTGTEIEISVLWKDENGQVQTAPAQNWVRDMTTGKAMTHPWVFAGSQWYEDEETGQKYYMADTSGELICVSNFSSATLDVPVESSDSNAALMFEAFTENIPPLGTPVTLVLSPKQAVDPANQNEEPGANP